MKIAVLCLQAVKELKYISVHSGLCPQTLVKLE